LIEHGHGFLSLIVVSAATISEINERSNQQNNDSPNDGLGKNGNDVGDADHCQYDECDSDCRFEYFQ
jgi:hypothetical protein